MNGDRGTHNELPGTAENVVQARDIHGNLYLQHANPSPAPLATPKQLPTHTPYFVGRAAELDQLSSLLDTVTIENGTVVISAINGTAGVGKTALALHWAHQAADRFPDGQLYVNLRGFAPAGTPPMSVAEAVRGFLDALAIPPKRIPVSLDGQAALYRSLLADRKMLILLDNVASAEDVRPLLPASAGCLVMITSRDQLTGLVAHEGARIVTLRPLVEQDATLLLERFLGKRRVAAEPGVAAEVIEYCAGLPLALSLVAARAAARPDFPLDAIVHHLRDERTRLDALDKGDPSTGIRAALSWSYRQLDKPTARMFRVLGVHPGPSTSVDAAASSAGVPVRQARAAMDELTKAHLLAERRPGRYAFHDLLRAYAADEANHEDAAAERRATTSRMLDHYLRSSSMADHQLDPYQEPVVSLSDGLPDVICRDIANYDDAVAWFTIERRTLLAVIDHAAACGFDTQTWQLAWTLTTYFHRWGHWHDLAATQEKALKAAIRLGDPAARAVIHRELGWAYARLARYQDALKQHRESLTLFAELGDDVGAAHTHHAISFMWEQQGKHAMALTHSKLALNHANAAGSLSWQAHALDALGRNYVELGNYSEALTHCPLALDLHRTLGNRLGEANTLASLGYAYHHVGRHDEAITSYTDSIAEYQRLGDSYNEATTLVRLGDAHRVTGDIEAAQKAWLHALSILDDMGHPDADQVREKLREL